jgi:hypothetical protein
MIRMVWRSVVGLRDVGVEVMTVKSLAEAAEVVDEFDIVGAAVATVFEDGVGNDGVVEYRRS